MTQTHTIRASLKFHRTRLIIVAAIGICASHAPGAEARRDDEIKSARVDFSRQIRPLLINKCFKCHGPDAAVRQAGLRLDIRDVALAELESGNIAVVPGDSRRSELIHRVASSDPGVRMPPPESGLDLTTGQIDLLRRWIDEGAQWRPHWSFVGPERIEPPRVQLSLWPINPIDRFVLAGLEREGLQPSRDADRFTLIRRVSLDLIGLPPTLEEVEAFTSDESPGAFERLVDRLLDSPHFGERWARVWLDLARYADSQGYEKDNRRTIWRYRDWVIAALNRDMPFDQFTVEQIAGDLLPDASTDQLIATAFHRNTMTNYEGGTDDEEFRVAAVVDRINTTMQVWMGLTVGCAQCHSHKYDPISNEEYYQLFAFFNQTADNDQPDDRPRIDTPTRVQRTERGKLRKREAALRVSLQELQPTLDAARRRWESTAFVDLNPPTRDGLVAHYELDGHAADTSGSYRHGTVKEGESAYAAGVRGRAAEFDGKRYIDLGDLGDFERTEAFSFGGWVYPRKGDVLVPFARMDTTGGAHRGYDAFIFQDKVFVHIIHEWPENCIRVNTPTKIKRNRWQHLMVTVDGSSKAGGVKIYLDGEPQPMEITHDTLTETIRTDKPFHIGRRFGQRSFNGMIDDVRVYRGALRAAEVETLVRNGIHAIVTADPGSRSKQQRELVHEYFVKRAAPQVWKKYAAALDEVTGELSALQRRIPTTPVMKALPPEKRRETHVLVRGDFLNPAQRVEPGVPAVFRQVSDETPHNRLEFARWLVDEKNPLTARVTVNRFWEQLFGVGIVETSEDFGAQGEPPSHPELLDWLARAFVRQGWSVKELCRLIVTSATYRQSSRQTPELIEKDPRNRLLARGARFRLEAEMIRDQALAVSGLLSRKLFGPSVMPPQPEGVWQIVYSSDVWKTSVAGDSRRRGLYTFWRRTAPYPSMETFDAPSREVCTVRRIRTNTPLQALVTLNDPVYIEAAQALARRTLGTECESIEDRITFGFRACLARPPTADEIKRLNDLYQDTLATYQDDSHAAFEMAIYPLGPVSEGTDIAKLAAWTVVGNVILNLDELLTRN